MFRPPEKVDILLLMSLLSFFFSFSYQIDQQILVLLEILRCALPLSLLLSQLWLMMIGE